MTDFFSKANDWIAATKLQEQVSEVDFVGLFTNPWFLVPFVIIIGFLLYKQEFKNLIFISVVIALWWVSGTEYMNTLIVGDELQAKKVIPVVFGGAAALGLLIYVFFGRDD